MPQNDGRIQFHHVFAEWIVTPGVRDANGAGWLTPPALKAGHHCALAVMSTPGNPNGLIGPQDAAMLTAAGVEALRASDIDVTYLPKFQ